MRTHPFALALTLALVVASARGADADGCRLAPQGDGRVVAVDDALSLRLDDGREVKLAGLARTDAPREAATAALSRLVLGQRIALFGDSDAPDRHGRQIAWVFRADAAQEASVQARLLSDGAAVFSGEAANRDCRAELVNAERAARAAARGLWAEPAAIKNPENPGDIVSRIGRFTLVEGRVVSVRDAGTAVYLNFGRRWTQDFAVTISRRGAAAFEAAGMALKSLERRRILVRGYIEARSQPRIELRHVGQIEIVGAN